VRQAVEKQSRVTAELGRQTVQSTGAAALRPILQAQPLALRVHRERAIVDKSTDLWAADLHAGRALRKDNRGPRMLALTRTRRASCRPGGGRPSSPPERPCPGLAMRGGFFHPSLHLTPVLEERHGEVAVGSREGGVDVAPAHLGRQLRLPPGATRGRGAPGARRRREQWPMPSKHKG